MSGDILKHPSQILNILRDGFQWNYIKRKRRKIYLLKAAYTKYQTISGYLFTTESIL